MKKTVVLGMSGGVDSSVAAYLLKKEGYNVIGVTMQIWQKEDRDVCETNNGCCGSKATADARRVADTLDIPYYVMNFREEFQKNVIDYFIEEYIEGNTPNPCIACNRYVKWESFLKKAMMLGADYIATGHYANIVQLDNGRYSIKTSKTAAKDQTYSLYNLTQEQLSKTLVPVGKFTKDEIRKIATDIGLTVANKPDSQEICFIPDNNHGKFIEENSDKEIKQGNFVDKNGKVLGNHKGIIYYTIGQRKGLGIALGKPAFITDINIETGNITLGDNEDLFNTVVYAKNVNFMSITEFEKDKIYKAKIRYSAKPSDCYVEYNEGILKVTFLEPQRAQTRGQAIVVYDEDLVAGGGTII
ncbi:MAG: tRNA 2-thiouridine(34) synthase MnmA [Lachnospirales bacterium]